MNVYLIWGRVPGADDDTSYVIAASRAVDAEEQFADLLHEEYNEADLDAVDREHGVTVFTNGIEQIGELVEINGEKLIRPVAGSICGL